MKKALKITFLGVLGLVVVAAALVWMEFGALANGAASCRKLDDGLYYMEYKGDDGFRELMARGGCADVSSIATYVAEFLSKGHFKPEKIDPPIKTVGCSTLAVSTPDGGRMMARNFDYPYGTALVVHTVPDEGYEAITTFSTDFFGFGDDYKPEGFANQYKALAGIFFALDGLNEKGLAVACLCAGDTEFTHQKSDKPDLTSTTSIQYLLKNAANVDEAISLLDGIDMNTDPGSAYHFAMADASGKSIVVEYVDNEMIVTETPFVTNHYLCEAKFQVGLSEYDHRHETLMAQYDSLGGVMNTQQLTEVIQSVAQKSEKEDFIGGTLWTMVMDLTHPSVTYYSRRHFDKPFHFEFERK